MKYQEVIIKIDSPYKWGQGWTSTREASDAFNDNLMGIVAELGMDINMSDMVLSKVRVWCNSISVLTSNGVSV